LKEALVEHYRFSWGKHKSKAIHEVPNVYLRDLANNRDKICDDEILLVALRLRNDRLGRSNKKLDENIERWNILKGDDVALKN
jgi:hypothetical protein